MYSLSRRRGLIAGLAALGLLALGACSADGGLVDADVAEEAPPTSPATATTVALTSTAPASTTVVPSTTLAPSTTAPATAPPPPAPVTFTVSHVVDGDTVDVAGSDGTADTVRLIGIDAPEAAACGALDASAALAALVGNGELVVLTPGARDDRDKYGRLLRYVEVNSVDAGLILIERGVAIARYDSRDGYGAHPREAAYAAADEAAADFTCAPPPPTEAPLPPTEAPPPPSAAPPPPENSCDPNYTGCVPIASDVDCAGGSGNGPAYTDGPVEVVGSDIYGLDRDGDGVGCE